MSGTDLRHGDTCLRACYAMSGTDPAYGAILLCYAMSGTDLAYGARRGRVGAAWGGRISSHVCQVSYAMLVPDIA
eukprot:3212753-Rhodomonas_salina.1